MTSTRYNQWSFWAVVAVLLLPGGAAGSLAGVLALLLTFLLIPLALKQHASRLIAAQPTMVALLAVFAALALCYTITADEPADVLFAVNFLALLLAPLVYLGAYELRGPQLISRIAMLALIGSAVAAAYSLFQIVAVGADRAFAPFAGGNLMPRVALVCGFIALAGWFVTQGRVRLIYLAGPALAILGVFLSGSRGSALAVPFAVVIAGVFVLTDPTTRHPWRTLLLVVGTVVAGFAAAAWLAGLAGVGVGVQSLLDRVQQIATTMIDVAQGGSTSDLASLQRLDMLRAAYGAFLDAPLFGHGWGNFQAAATPHATEMLGSMLDPHFMFHNDIANFAVAAGVVGLACWLVLILAPGIGLAAVPLDPHGRVRLYCIVLLIVVYAVFGLTDMTLGYDMTTVLYAYLCAIVLGGMRQQTPAPARVAS